MKGLRKIAPKAPPKPRPGLDDPQHKAQLKRMVCLLRGKRCRITRWVGVYPNTKQITEEYLHICIGIVDPHHTEKKSQLGHDHTCVPLCRGGHDEAEKLGNDGMLERWGIDLKAEALKLAPRKEGTLA